MILKHFKFLGLLLFILLIGGCGSDVPYDANLFKATENNCWPCQMYMQAFRAMDQVLDGSLETIAENSLIILKLGLIFWLLFKIGSLVGSFSMPDMKKEFVSFISVLFKAFIVAMFLNNPTYIYDFFGGLIIQPFGEGFLSLSGTVLESTGDLGIDFDYNNPVTSFFSKLWKTMKSWFDFGGGSAANAPSTTKVDLTSKMFGGLAKSVMETVFKIYHALWSGVGLGVQLWTMKGFSAAIAGLFLIAGMLWLVIMMPLAFVDAFVRIGLVLMLLPLLMVGWVFSFPKKDIVKKVFHTILAGFFDILFACIYITFLVSLFRVYEQEELPYMFSSSAQTTEGAMRTVGNEFGTDFLILLMLTWSMVKLSGKINSFSGYFFEGAGKSNATHIINGLKNLAVKGARIGIYLFSGPAGWAKAGVDVAKDTMSQAANGGDSEKNKDGNNSQGQSKSGTESKFDGDGKEGKSTGSSGDGKKDNSPKAAKKNSAGNSSDGKKDNSPKADKKNSTPKKAGDK